MTAPGRAFRPRYHEAMLRLSRITPRKALIVIHDLLATAAAVVASFYIRFEEMGLATRLDGLLKVIPGFVVYAGVVYWIFHLYEGKWRFASLPDLSNIFRAVSVLAVSMLVLDYILVSPYLFGTFFFGKITIVLYWCLQMFFLGGPRVTYRYFRFARTRQQAMASDSSPALVLGRAADAEVLLRAVESGAVKKILPVGILSPSKADQGQSLRGISVLGTFVDLGTRNLGPGRTRHQGQPTGPDVERARTGGRAGIAPDAGAAAGTDREPPAVLRRGRRRAADAAARSGRGRGFAAAAERQDRLSPP